LPGARFVPYRGAVRPTLRALALVCLATYVVAASAPCPPVRSASTGGIGAGPRAPIELAHATHSHHGAAAVAAHAEGDAGDSGVALKAICPCGCGKRAAAAGAAGALADALLRATDAWTDPPGDAPLVARRLTLPGVTPRTIDHVPLTAV
jgi:hypothetical protein